MPSSARDDDGIAVAECGQLGPELRGPAAVVDGDRSNVDAARAEHDDASAHVREGVELGLQARGVGALGAGCREDEAARTLSAQRADEPHLALRVALGDRDGDDEPRLVGAARDARGDLAEVGVGDVGDQQGHDRRGAARGRLRGEVRGVAELRAPPPRRGCGSSRPPCASSRSARAMPSPETRRPRAPHRGGLPRLGKTPWSRSQAESRARAIRQRCATGARRCGDTAAANPAAVRCTATSGSVAQTSALKISTSMSPSYPVASTARGEATRSRSRRHPDSGG